MLRKVTIIYPSGNISQELVKTGKSSAPYDTLRTAVNGLIQIVPGFNKYENRRCTAYCNEEGLLLGLPFNPVATKLWRERLGYSDKTKHKFWTEPTIVGPLVIDQKGD